jgi:chaperonin GroEL (HSP60 family)
MVKAGIIDPTEVVRPALQNAIVKMPAIAEDGEPIG